MSSEVSWMITITHETMRGFVGDNYPCLLSDSSQKAGRMSVLANVRVSLLLLLVLVWEGARRGTGGIREGEV